MEDAMIDFTLIWESLPALFHGTIISLQITSIAALVGICLGSLLAALETTKSVALRAFVGTYVTLFRGTPMLVQILFVYYVLPQFGVMVPPFWAASLAIGLNSAAYISQILKSGIQSIPKGQFEAAATLGLNPLATMRYILFPQAFRMALPSLGNELVTLVKDSSLASIIGVMELSKEASIIRSRTYDAFSILLAISLIYLLLTSVIAYCLKTYEKRINIHA